DVAADVQEAVPYVCHFRNHLKNQRESEGHPLLLSSGIAADRAAFADLRHASVSICYRKWFHKCSINRILPLMKNICTEKLTIRQRKAFKMTPFLNLADNLGGAYEFNLRVVADGVI
ncbi:MAG: hypothetical protein KKA48_06060, partial [Proteobacteria bacterium]|nr:hypothetical protein [Pseudomonadota bacterium]